MDRLYIPEPSPLRLSELRVSHPEAFSPESERALESVVRDMELPFPLSDFQIFSVNCLLNRKDLLCVVPTGPEVYVSHCSHPEKDAAFQ